MVVGNKGAVHGCQDAEAEIVAVSHKASDVVSEAR